MSEEERHHGSYAEGEAKPDEYPDEEHVGHFSEGQESEHSDEGHVGRYSEGEEQLGEEDPEKHHEGSFGDENE